MNEEPRFEADYTDRQTTAAHRVLVDLGQVLASFKECVVVVGGCTPSMLGDSPVSRAEWTERWKASRQTLGLAGRN